MVKDNFVPNNLDDRMFFGHKKMTTDKKGRVFLPARFRLESIIEGLPFVILCNFNQLLENQSIPNLSIIDENVFNEKIRTKRNESFYNGIFDKLNLEPNFRFHPSQDFRDFAQIKKSDEIYFIGEGQYLSLYNAQNAKKILNYLALNVDINRSY